MVEAKDIGPLQLVVVGFDSPNFSGKIAQELQRLSQNDTIAVVDAIAAVKDSSGNLNLVQASGLTREEAGEYGSYIGTLLAIGSGNEPLTELIAKETAARFQDRYDYGLDQQDIDDIARLVPDEGGALMMLIEHKWLLPIREAMVEQGGFLLAQEFLSRDLLIALGAEILDETKDKNKKVKVVST